LVVAAVLTACSRAPIAEAPAVPVFFIHHIHSSSPSPLNEVKAGHVRAVFPDSWTARPLPVGEIAQEGFVASPNIDDWLRGTGTPDGMEAFWVDVGADDIPSNYYYLAARGPALSPLALNRSCHPVKQRILVDHPPDFTGATASPGDYVASGEGTCRGVHGPTHWAYVVVAPGFGPDRGVGLPTSGLYVVMASVSGPRSEFVLKEMIQSAWFGNAALSDIVKAASGQTR
jgi:hypothetical protein